MNQRAKNQQAISFAQMELRVDMEVIWRTQEELSGETILIKLVLPSGTELQAKEYLAKKNINAIQGTASHR